MYLVQVNKKKEAIRQLTNELGSLMERHTRFQEAFEKEEKVEMTFRDLQRFLSDTLAQGSVPDPASYSLPPGASSDSSARRDTLRSIQRSLREMEQQIAAPSSSNSENVLEAVLEEASRSWDSVAEGLQQLSSESRGSCLFIDLFCPFLNLARSVFAFVVSFPFFFFEARYFQI